MTRIKNILICIAVAALFVSFWALLNQPEIEPPWPNRIQGFSFSPMQVGDDPTKKIFPSESEIEADLKLLSGTTNAVRTYTVEGVQAKIPELARKYDLNVTLGAWISADLEQNEEQVESVIRIAKENYKNVIRVIVGNEAVLRGDITVKQLDGYIERVQQALDMPVSTAEPWHVWIQHPELANHVDFIATHMLPYWEGIRVDKAVDYVIDRYDTLAKNFPDKLIVIGEVGWPSNGRKRQEAVASEANQATFLRRFLAKAEELEYVYYVMEAFDQPWKQKGEGGVGAYWGVYDTLRQAKFPFTSPIVYIPEWPTLAAISVFISAFCFMLLVIDSRALAIRGRGFLASIAFVSATGAVWIVYSYSRQYLTLSTIFVGILMITGLIGVVIVLLAEAHEWAEAIWGSMGRRTFLIEDLPDDTLPKVSIHVPAYNEPPEMMVETLNALAKLDYPCFEVIVMDNNTKDPEIWRPVEAHCKTLGEHFKFFHEDNLAGFKAGALNYALARTAPDATVIAVIDSDYAVESDWLRDLAPQFLKPEVAIVQAPQDYRDDHENLFKAMCYAEYRGFFSIGMVIRNERNAIIQHGTMTMVRRTVLEEVGAWAEWCITEDAELGLRIFEKGHEAVYVAKSYGKGLMPDTFIDFKKQRFRWAYGSVQIIRHHLGALLRDKQSRLTYGQRYHFIAGWLPWMADSMNLIFIVGALLWSLFMIHNPTKVDAPMMILSIVPLVFFVFKVVKMLYLYHRRVNASATQAIASAIAGLALTHTIAKAMIFGLFTKHLPFFRTPKKVAGSHFWYALQSAREEGLIAVALLLSAYCIYNQNGSETTDHLIWVIVLCIQSIPYVAAVVLSFISACAQFPEKLVEKITTLPVDKDQVTREDVVNLLPSKKLRIQNRLLALCLAAPFLLPAFWRLLSKSLTEPIGLFSDLGIGLALFSIAWLAPRWLRVVLLVFWSVFQIVSRELVAAVERLPSWQDVHYLFDPTFLENSSAGLHVAEPIFVGVLVILTIVAALVKLVRPGKKSLITVIMACLFLLLQANYSGSYANQSIIARYNPLHWFVADALLQYQSSKAVKLDMKDLPLSLRTLDLTGKSLLDETKAKNVLVIVLEGISGIYHPEIREHIGVPEGSFQMLQLAESMKKAMLIPDFVDHSHQTIRGLYALHCGDISKLSYDTPKGVELQLNPARAEECLPSQMAKNGWDTHFLQGAPLQFMNKDKVMPSMGFQEVHGSEWFPKKAKNDFVWGTTDEDFFKGARKYVQDLQKKNKPWMLSLLTVGTHQPFDTPAGLSKKYGSRKIASVAQLDKAVAQFINGLRQDGVLDDTLVLITSDESHGAEGADWYSSWGLAGVIAPGKADLPRLKEGTFALMDVEASILDYFKLPMPPSIIGRSFFRDYVGSRDMVSYTSGKLRWQTADNKLYECSVDGNCSVAEPAKILSPRRELATPDIAHSAPRLFGMASLLDHKITVGLKTHFLQFGHGEIRPLPEKIKNEWSDNLVGAQYLDFPKNSKVDVDILLKAVTAEPAGIQLKLVLRQFEKEVGTIQYPTCPVLKKGEECHLQFSFENKEARKAFSFHLLGEGRNSSIQLEKFEVAINLAKDNRSE